MTRYNKRVYHIDEINFDVTPESTFVVNEKGKERTISYSQYYKEKYGVTINDTSQPLLVHIKERTNQKIYLVPETCQLTGISDDLKAKNSREMREELFANAETKYKRI